MIVYKNQSSENLKRLNDQYLKKCSEEKQKYAERIVSDLKTSNPSKWYSKLKRMSGQDKNDDTINVTELDGIYDKLQAEVIADHYAEVSNQFEAI